MFLQSFFESGKIIGDIFKVEIIRWHICVFVCAGADIGKSQYFVNHFGNGTKWDLICMDKAMIFDIQHASVVDGPGMRTTVFFKGCNLKCRWCHNLESQSSEKQVMFYKNRCVGCGRCRGIDGNDTDFICYHNAREVCGEEYTVDELFENIVCDKAFYEISGGGVTFSGGECMLKVDFLCDILRKCKESGISTAVDTAGNVKWECFERIIPYTDLFLYDIKAYDEDLHKKYTGVSNKCILENIKRLFGCGANVWIRIPIICGVNDTVEEMQRIKKFLLPYKPLDIELLPYHGMGEHKYEALGLEKMKFDTPRQEVIERLNDIFRRET